MVANYQAILSKHWNDESGQCVYVIATTNSKISQHSLPQTKHLQIITTKLVIIKMRLTRAISDNTKTIGHLVIKKILEVSLEFLHNNYTSVALWYSPVQLRI